MGKKKSVHRNKKKTTSTRYKNASVEFADTFPYFMDVEIWVEARSQLGKSESDRVKQMAQRFGEFVVVVQTSDLTLVFAHCKANSIVTNPFPCLDV